MESKFIYFGLKVGNESEDVLERREQSGKWNTKE